MTGSHPTRDGDPGDGAQSSSAQGGYPSVQGSYAGAQAAPLTSWSGSPEQGSAGSFDDGNAFGGIIGRSVQAAAESPLPGVQRADNDSAAPAGASAAGSGAPGAGPSARELDELARKLYEPLRRRFQRELTVDRERDGSLLSTGR